MPWRQTKEPETEAQRKERVARVSRQIDEFLRDQAAHGPSHKPPP